MSAVDIAFSRNGRPSPDGYTTSLRSAKYPAIIKSTEPFCRSILQRFQGRLTTCSDVLGIRLSSKICFNIRMLMPLSSLFSVTKKG